MKMKKKLLFAVFAVLTAGFIISCDDDVTDDLQGQLPENQVISVEHATYTLSFRELNNILKTSYLDPTVDLDSVGGVYWGGTMDYKNNQLIETTDYTFSHSADSTWYEDYGGYYVISWSGFTISNVNDKQNYGFAGPSGSSLWSNHQWGTMAATAPYTEAYENPFLVAFWSFYNDADTINSSSTFAENKYTLWTRVGTGNTAQAAHSLKIGLHPWSYYGITTGDGFARPLDKATDYFSVKIYGVKNDKTFTGPVIHYFLNNSKDISAKQEWETVDIRDLGNVTHLVFRMETTDVGDYGPNTAFYFCLQDIGFNDPQ